MTRQQRRKEIRDIEKEMKFIEKHTDFMKIMRSNSFSKLPDEDIKALQSGIHVNKRLQGEYINAQRLIARVTALSARWTQLKRIETIPDVKEHELGVVNGESGDGVGAEQDLLTNLNPNGD